MKESRKEGGKKGKGKKVKIFHGYNFKLYSSLPTYSAQIMVFLYIVQVQLS